MRKINWNAALTIVLICGILSALTIADFFTKERFFSEMENRVLATKPAISDMSVKYVFSGEYMSDYDTYVTDQFVGRDAWIQVKTRTDMLLQKKELNGVYLGKDNYLIEQHKPEQYPQELVNKKLALLKALVERWDAKVMLVPTADNVLTEKLPAYADYFDETAFLQEVTAVIGEGNMIDVSETLRLHKGEDIYYRTDHHWTTKGAYYGYLQWAECMGEPTDLYNLTDSEIVTETFMGTLHSKINLPVAPDTITYFPETQKLAERIVYDMQKKSDSFYEAGYLEGKNKYGYFLDDNHAFIEIDTTCHNGKTLFVLKDSYANCVIPLLAAHYEKIYVVDLRYMNGKLFPFMEQYEPAEGMDVLVLYNCIHFLDEFRYW